MRTEKITASCQNLYFTINAISDLIYTIVELDILMILSYRNNRIRKRLDVFREVFVDTVLFDHRLQR